MGLFTEFAKAIAEGIDAEHRKLEAMRKAALTKVVFVNKTSLVIMNSFQRRLSVKTPDNMSTEITLTRESFDDLKKNISKLNYSDILKLTVVEEGLGIYSVEAAQLI